MQPRPVKIRIRAKAKRKQAKADTTGAVREKVTRGFISWDESPPLWISMRRQVSLAEETPDRKSE